MKQQQQWLPQVPRQTSNNQKLSNPWEFSNYNPPQASRPLPKYVTDAKKKFFNGNDDYDYEDIIIEDKNQGYIY